MSKLLNPTTRVNGPFPATPNRDDYSTLANSQVGKVGKAQRAPAPAQSHLLNILQEYAELRQHKNRTVFVAQRKTLRWSGGALRFAHLPNLQISSPWE